jgi:Spy/CpxP family protein refolding chaperone
MFGSGLSLDYNRSPERFSAFGAVTIDVLAVGSTNDLSSAAGRLSACGMLANRPGEKTMKRHLGALLLTFAAFVASPAGAQGNTADATDMQALRSALRTDKKAYVASVLKLTDAEAKKFWPAYDAYQRTFAMTNREKSVTLEGVIAQDKPISDPYAKQIAKEVIAADEVEVKARRTLYDRLVKAVPAKTALRYLQLEAKFRAVQAYDIAQAIPLVK